MDPPGSAAGVSGFHGTVGEAAPSPRSGALPALPGASGPCGAAGAASPAALREFPPSPRTVLNVPWGVGPARCCNGKLSLEERLDKSVEDKPACWSGWCCPRCPGAVPAASGFAPSTDASCTCDRTRIVCVRKERGTGGVRRGWDPLWSRVNPAEEGSDSRLAAQDPSLPPSLPSIFRRLANLKHS